MIGTSWLRGALIGAAMLGVIGDAGIAAAQPPANPLVGIAHSAGSELWAVTLQGDVYVSLQGTSWTKKPNAFGGLGIAQAVGIAATANGVGAFVVATDGRVVAFNGFTWSDRENVFTGTSPGTVVALAYIDNSLWAATGDGTVRFSLNGTSWQSRENLFGGSVPNRIRSWGSVKANYNPRSPVVGP